MRGRVPAPGSPLCTIDGCTYVVSRRGLCRLHCGTRPCSRDACPYTAIRRGLCQNHYAAARYHGELLAFPRMARTAPTGACKVDGCSKVAAVRQCCKYHYGRLLATGNAATPPYQAKLIELDGRKQSVAAWAAEFGVSRQAINERVTGGRLRRAGTARVCSQCHEAGHNRRTCETKPTQETA